MKTRNAVILLWALLLISLSHDVLVFGFLAGIGNRLTIRTHRPSKLTPFRSTVPSETDATPNKETPIDGNAIEALEKIRSRQAEDLRQTESLLERVLEVARMDTATTIHPPSTASSPPLFSLGENYGYTSRSEGAPSTLKPGGKLPQTEIYGGPPANVVSLGVQQFVRNWEAIRGEYSDETNVTLTPKQVLLQSKLKQLTLNTTEIWERELADGPIQAPLVIKVPYFVVCFLLDVVFEGRFVPSRFFLLETGEFFARSRLIDQTHTSTHAVARMPYFSYISMLHLYETLGFWRRSAEVKRIHFAEELNEYRHLLIMESLGGDQAWWVRFVAQHSAVLYYFVLCLLFALSPTLSYRFSELLETHAVNTYSVFLSDNEELLKSLPPPSAAVEYYTFGTSDPFYAEFQTAALSSGRGVSM